MKTPKAIEIMRDLLGDGPHFSPEDRRKAVLEAIAALEEKEAMGKVTAR